MPLFDPPRHDSAETIRRALNLGVNVKMITGACSNILYCQFFFRLMQEYRILETRFIQSTLNKKKKRKIGFT